MTGTQATGPQLASSESKVQNALSMCLTSSHLQKPKQQRTSEANGDFINEGCSGDRVTIGFIP